MRSDGSKWCRESERDRLKKSTMSTLWAAAANRIVLIHGKTRIDRPQIDGHGKQKTTHPRNASGDAGMVQDAAGAQHHHVGTKGTDAHRDEAGGGVEYEVVPQGLERVDVHVVEGLGRLLLGGGGGSARVSVCLGLIGAHKFIESTTPPTL